MHNLIICPGAQKAGTTWLYKALKAHPEFNMPTVKELTYLCDYPQKRARHIERYEKSKTSMTPEERAWWQIFLAEKSDENSAICSSELMSGTGTATVTRVPVQTLPG